jgi:predicted Zn-ribbon and HTH transcriptional regulator
MLSKTEKSNGMKECKVCGYKWISRKLNPKACPECKSRNWAKGKK